MVERGLQTFLDAILHSALNLGVKYEHAVISCDSFLCFLLNLVEVEEDCLEPIGKLLEFVLKLLK
jgi:hypothetical protein